MNFVHQNLFFRQNNICGRDVKISTLVYGARARSWQNNSILIYGYVKTFSRNFAISLK